MNWVSHFKLIFEKSFEGVFILFIKGYVQKLPLTFVYFKFLYMLLVYLNSPGKFENFVLFHYICFCSKDLWIFKMKVILIDFISIGIYLYIMPVKITLVVPEMQKFRHCRNLSFHKNQQFSHEHMTNGYQ